MAENQGSAGTNKKVLIVENMPKKEPLRVKTGVSIKITRRRRKFLFSF
ncbi:MAG: hypothetical protein H6Q30_950 [Bacteroidetes bacterium]|jgi:hypothetical protein|nr:hypothetical protein [Bacteroidota bacterium]